MPRQSDPSIDSLTTSAELNPLVNPLLAENMGRWAETYFTSPPENREQAVLDLIRQLEAEKASGLPGPASQRNMRSQVAATTFGDAPVAPCPTCGHENPVSHNFCGMCGAATTDDSGWTIRDTRRADSDLRRATVDDSSSESSGDGWDSRSYEPSEANAHELSLFQNISGGRSDYDDGGWVYEPAPSRYRGFIGALLVIVIVGLGYLAWRGMQNSRSSEASPAPPPVVKENPAPEPAASQPAPIDAAKQPVANPPASEKAAEPPAKAPELNAKQSPQPVTEPKPVPAAKPDSGRKAADLPTPAASGNGGEELALAQRFLSGTNGQGRDPAEAAKKLWKAIEKHNTQATVLLADLYLKGDGVPKNCDQARVLLYSAARKNVTGAGERLRNLQAFGCQ